MPGVQKWGGTDSAHLLSILRADGRSEMGEAAFESSQRNFPGKLKDLKSSQVRSKVKIATFCLIGYRNGANNSCESNFCQNDFQGMKKIAYKYGSYAK